MFVGVLCVYWRGEEGCDLVPSLERSEGTVREKY